MVKPKKPLPEGVKVAFEAEMGRVRGRVMVDQHLMAQYPERFLPIRRRYDLQLAALEQKTDRVA